MRKLFLLSLTLFAAAALGAEDVGLVNYLAGDASYESGGKRAKAAAYMKVREGDRFTLSSGAKLRVVYFQGSRQESFAGPARFVVGKQDSRLESGARPEVATLPSSVSHRIAQTPELVEIAKLGRAGGVSVRSARVKPLTPEQQAEVAEARATYARLRQSAPADDITPELFLYSVLEEYSLFDDMRTVVAEMRRRQPANADVAALAEYLEGKSPGR